MIDLWVSILITLSISIGTVLTDWIAGKIVIYSRVITNVRRIVFSDLSAEDARIQARREFEGLRATTAASLIWGSDLAIVAVSMDFTALGIWIYKPEFFPFFSQFNQSGASRELQIWFSVLLFHFVLLLFSVVCKHHQQMNIGLLSLDEMKDFFEKKWFAKNKWQLASNFIGFMTLLTAIIVFTNSI